MNHSLLKYIVLNIRVLRIFDFMFNKAPPVYGTSDKNFIFSNLIYWRNFICGNN